MVISAVELHEVLLVWTSALAGKKFLHGDEVSMPDLLVFNEQHNYYSPTQLLVILTYTTTCHLHLHTGEHAGPAGVRRAALHPGSANLRRGDGPQPAAGRVVRCSGGVVTVQPDHPLTSALLSTDRLYSVGVR